MGSVYEFDDVRVEPSAFRVLKAGRPIAIEPKAFDLLGFLIQHRGRLVEKQELLDAVWKDTAVTENALTRVVAQLRKALGDPPAEPRYIETVPTRGYRFIAPVRLVDASSVATGPSVPETTPGPGRGRTIWLAGALAAAALLALLISFTPVLRRNADAPDHPRIRSLAVLPLANLTGDPAQEYFSDGMTDALITNLASLPALHVISRQSVMRYKGSAKPLPEIARELGVEGVVEGSVVRSGGRVRISAQLVYAPADRHLWAQSYERRLEDVLTLQGELARAIAEAVRITVGTKEGRRLGVQRAVKPDAYDAYLLGRHHWNQRTEPALDRALAHFRAAVASDPDFALAHAGLALALGPRQVYAYVPPGTGLAEQKAAAPKALELDPGLAEARAAPGGRPYHRVGLGRGGGRIPRRHRARPELDGEPPLVRVASAFAWTPGRERGPPPAGSRVRPAQRPRQPCVRPRSQRRRRRVGGPGPLEPGPRAGAAPGFYAPGGGALPLRARGP
jgi:TolB-like protein/DNA-binding winged helix-turn-helix (wHTH) protein